MSSWPAKLIALVAAVHLLGGHWAVLQVVAWAEMVVTYSQDGTLAAAVEKTFDGEHPCERCHIVKEGQQKEQQGAAQKILLKWDAVLVPVALVPELVFSEMVFPAQGAFAPLRTAAPLSPPPLA